MAEGLANTIDQALLGKLGLSDEQMALVKSKMLLRRISDPLSRCNRVSMYVGMHVCTCVHIYIYICIYIYMYACI